MHIWGGEGIHSTLALRDIVPYFNAINTNTDAWTMSYDFVDGSHNYANFSTGASAVMKPHNDNLALFFEGYRDTRINPNEDGPMYLEQSDFSNKQWTSLHVAVDHPVIIQDQQNSIIGRGAHGHIDACVMDTFDNAVFILDPSTNILVRKQVHQQGWLFEEVRKGTISEQEDQSVIIPGFNGSNTISYSSASWTWESWTSDGFMKTNYLQGFRSLLSLGGCTDALYNSTYFLMMKGLSRDYPTARFIIFKSIKEVLSETKASVSFGSGDENNILRRNTNKTLQMYFVTSSDEYNNKLYYLFGHKKYIHQIITGIAIGCALFLLLVGGLIWRFRLFCGYLVYNINLVLNSPSSFLSLANDDTVGSYYNTLEIRFCFKGTYSNDVSGSLQQNEVYQFHSSRLYPFSNSRALHTSSNCSINESNIVPPILQIDLYHPLQPNPNFEIYKLNSTSPHFRSSPRKITASHRDILEFANSDPKDIPGPNRYMINLNNPKQNFTI
ncbi:hypothetical protein BDA99DRAFT_537502 [Phascolomyces articulosus]|uniref:Uncharacterized protein n=1 Tax=Phascolomyces articulosus TaxID=60185 RepID=A0AAD5K9K1_9FUNG|nr:hypothetical protein BDA99DRAFT_537502 [Phascolomyces articulosus]